MSPPPLAAHSGERVQAPAPDAESQGWLAALRGSGSSREDAVARLHGLLLRAARFEVSRRAPTLGRFPRDELDDIAVQAADDAVVALLAKLDRYRGASRFTTWAYKFALLEAAVQVRRRAWGDREVPLEPEEWRLPSAEGSSPEERAEAGEVLQALRDGIDGALTPHQREVFAALALNEVPIDVLADRLGTTRGALYKTVHDARRKLREELGARGFSIGDGMARG
ncbi:MAG: sigma-70 family RNA polymerase sigma factor [Actinomycetota bacterium]|nr:sigma-70 family RNA polymerase sigma factor [Actinomycetota bacterium]